MCNYTYIYTHIHTHTHIYIYILQYIKQVNNKDHSTGSYIQYLIITISEKNLKKNIHTHIYISESLCYTLETNTALYINYTSVFKKRRPNLPPVYGKMHLSKANNFTATGKVAGTHKLPLWWIK